VWDKLFSRLSFVVSSPLRLLCAPSNLVSHRTSVPYSMFLDHLDLFRSDSSSFESSVSFDSLPPSVNQHGFN
jgi:hypothetical protein